MAGTSSDSFGIKPSKTKGLADTTGIVGRSSSDDSKAERPKADSIASSSTTALVAAAQSTAAAVEQLVKTASEIAQKPSCPVSSADGEQQKRNPSANAFGKAMANIGPCLPVLDHAVVAASTAVECSAQCSALPPARPKPVTFCSQVSPCRSGVQSWMGQHGAGL